MNIDISSIPYTPEELLNAAMFLVPILFVIVIWLDNRPLWFKLISTILLGIVSYLVYFFLAPSIIVDVLK